MYGTRCSLVGRFGTGNRRNFSSDYVFTEVRLLSLQLGGRGRQCSRKEERKGVNRSAGGQTGWGPLRVGIISGRQSNQHGLCLLQCLRCMQTVGRVGLNQNCSPRASELESE